jgi:hypothetical protein
MRLIRLSVHGNHDTGHMEATDVIARDCRAGEAFGEGR